MAQISNKFAIYITGGRFLSMIAGFIMPVVLVRMMSVGDYGLTSQFLTLYTSITAIAAFGVHTNIFYFCPTADKKTLDTYISNTLFLLFVFGAICGILLSIPPIKNLVFGDSELGRHSDLVILSIALATVTNMVSPLNTIRQDKFGALFFPGFMAFGQIGAILSSVLIYGDIHKMFLGLLIFQCIVTFSIVIYTRFKTRFSLDFHLMKEQLAYSLPFGFAVALQLFSNYFDKYVCIRMLSPTEYAIYGIAFLSIPGVSQIYDSLCQVNIVNMSNSFRSGKTNEILPQYGNFVVKTLSFSVPVILIVSLYAEEIMSFLYTDSYISAAPYFRLYSLTFLTSMLGAGTILRSMGKTKQSMYSFVMTCLFGLPTTYVLISTFGTTGAICGAMINMMLPRFIQMFFEVKATNSNIASYLPWRTVWIILAYSLFIMIPFVAIKYIYHLNIWCCMVESAVYVVFMYFLFIRKDIFIIDMATLLSYVKRFTK